MYPKRLGLYLWLGLVSRSNGLVNIFRGGEGGEWEGGEKEGGEGEGREWGNYAKLFKIDLKLT